MEQPVGLGFRHLEGAVLGALFGLGGGLGGFRGRFLRLLLRLRRLCLSGGGRGSDDEKSSNESDQVMPAHFCHPPATWTNRPSPRRPHTLSDPATGAAVTVSWMTAPPIGTLSIGALDRHREYLVVCLLIHLGDTA